MKILGSHLNQQALVLGDQDGGGDHDYYDAAASDDWYGNGEGDGSGQHSALNSYYSCAWRPFPGFGDGAGFGDDFGHGGDGCGDGSGAPEFDTDIAFKRRSLSDCAE